MRPIAEDILRERYYRGDEKEWSDIARRVAKYVSNGNGMEDAYYDMINTLSIIPNSPCLMNAGGPNPQLSACFAVGVDDSIESIGDAVKSAMIIHKSGGGTGFNFSNIRAKDSKVMSTDKVASGPVSFMKVFNSATDAIKQGSTRRGANLASLDVTHPDIKEFVRCKATEGDLSNFNISVNIPDSFMQNLDDPANREIFDMIVYGCWKNGEPGVIFSDAAEKDNKRPELGKLTGTNPCGETRLLPWESCNLASINLMNCFNGSDFDWERLASYVIMGVKFLNDMLDMNKYPLPQIEEATKKTRKIGLGVMGFADALIKLGYRYGDQDSLNFASRLFGFIRNGADQASEWIGGKLYNAAVISIAPTGSISLFAGVSSGIEPNFAYVYNRSTCPGVLRFRRSRCHTQRNSAHQTRDTVSRPLTCRG